MIESKKLPRLQTFKKLAIGAVTLATLVTLALAYKYQLNGFGNSDTKSKYESFHQQFGPKPYQKQPELNKTKSIREEETSLKNVPDIMSKFFPARKRVDQFPVLKSSYSQNDQNLLKMCENFIFNPYSPKENFTIADFGLSALTFKVQSAVYSGMFIHRYDEFSDLKLAAGPDVNQEKCLQQLKTLVERSKELLTNKYHSKDTNMFQLLDTFGHLPPGLSLGNSFFEGAYDECLRLKINMPNGETSAKTRYCAIGLKHKHWPQLDRQDLLKLKTGVCLPSSCDSLNYKNKFELIFKLIKFQLRDVEKDQLKLDYIYCLPDKDSPIRSISLSRGASLTLAGICAWLLLLVYATYKHLKLTYLCDKERVTSTEPSFGLTNGLSLSSKENGNEAAKEGALIKLFASLSIVNNLSNLFTISKESPLLELTSAGKSDKSKKVEHKRSLVDLKCIEGIKVISMCYVIMGHVLMCLPSMMANGRELSSGTNLAFYIANLAPAFAVNSFFTITGMLTTYLIFKQNQSHSFITKPMKWFAFILYRYIRIMPLYALVVLYTKTLAKYTGSGPFWDYGTSALSQRRVCEQESWAWTLLFGSNFLPPLEHCIPSAWYLANDFQFFVLTPPFLALLYKYPNLGQKVTKTCIVAGYMAGIWSIYSRHDIDARPIAQFAPNGFKTYISHFSSNYTHPQYRFPAYLIGLLVGHNLFCFERNKDQFLAAKRNQLEDNPNSNSDANDQKRPLNAESVSDGNHIDEPDWPNVFKKYTIPISLILIILCCLTPLIGSQVQYSRQGALVMVSLITPSYHIAFSLIVGSFILLATTGYANQRLASFLSTSLWKYLARLSLCAVLVNVEVINFLIQSSSSKHFFSNQFLISLNMLCIAATYLVSIVVCVLFEAPIRGLLNLMVAMPIGKYTSKSANQTKQVNQMKNKSD